ncbi:MAG: hypothetical protein HAW61_02855 [Candidatus Portiera sp.]|nr:hypothetical protein [Portiera sp.]
MVKLSTITYRKPETLSEFFMEEYEVPPHQSKYRWSEGSLQNIWWDIVQFHDESNQDDLYYFGRIYLRSTAQKGIWQVRDGGHRARNWPILLKAIYDKDPSNKGLEYLLHKKDAVKNMPILPKTPIVDVQIREESADYQEVMLCEDPATLRNTSKIHESYHCFSKLIDERAKSQQDPVADLVAITHTLLTRVVMLRTKSSTRYDPVLLVTTKNDRDTKVFAKQLSKTGFGSYAKEQGNEVISISVAPIRHRFYIRLVLMVGKPNELWKSIREGHTRTVEKRIRKIKKLWKKLTSNIL